MNICLHTYIVGTCNVQIDVLRMLVAGIDIGLVNLAFALYNTSSKEVHVDKISLIENTKYSESIIPFLVQNFVEKYRKVFEQCALIVIEYQMRYVHFVLLEYTISKSKKHTPSFSYVLYVGAIWLSFRMLSSAIF